MQAWKDIKSYEISSPLKSIVYTDAKPVSEYVLILRGWVNPSTQNTAAD